MPLGRPRSLRLFASLATCAALVAPAPRAFADGSDTNECVGGAEQAQPKRRAGKLSAARSDLVICSRPVCPPVIRADCIKWLTELDATIPTLIIRAVDSAGKDLVDVKVTIDGAPLVTKLDGRGVAVDPGVHAMRYEAAGHEPTSESLVVRETEKNRLVNVVLKDNAQQPVVVTPPPPLEQRTIPPLAFVLGVAGLAVIGGGVVFWVLGSGERADLRDGCAKTTSCKQDDVDAARTKMIVGDVLVGVGVVAVAAGVVVALTSSKKVSANAGIVPVSAGAGFGLSGAF